MNTVRQNLAYKVIIIIIILIFCASGVSLPVNAQGFYVAIEPVVSECKGTMRFITLTV